MCVFVCDNLEGSRFCVACVLYYIATYESILFVAWLFVLLQNALGQLWTSQATRSAWIPPSFSSSDGVCLNFSHLDKWICVSRQHLTCSSDSEDWAIRWKPGKVLNESDSTVFIDCICGYAAEATTTKRTKSQRIQKHKSIHSDKVKNVNEKFLWIESVLFIVFIRFVCDFFTLMLIILNTEYRIIIINKRNIHKIVYFKSRKFDRILVKKCEWNKFWLLCCAGNNNLYGTIAFILR